MLRVDIRRHSYRILACCVAIDIAAAIVFFATCLLVLPEGPSDLRPEAYAILFEFEGDGQLGPITRERVDLTASLALRDAESRVFCIGGARPARGFYGSRMMCDYFEALGIPATRTIAETESFDTRTNLKSLAGMAAAHGARMVVIITDPPHALRVRWLLDRMVGLPFAWTIVSTQPPRTIAGVVNTWGRLHQEWGAWIAEFVFPETVRNRILRTIRGQAVDRPIQGLWTSQLGTR